jgi:hypothetical protein
MVCIGSKAWIRENGIEISNQTEGQLHEIESRGETAVCVGFNHSFAGSISLLDVPKQEVALLSSFCVSFFPLPVITIHPGEFCGKRASTARSGCVDDVW